MNGERLSRSPMSLPIYRAVWISTLVSNLGTVIQSVGAAWEMTSLEATPQMVALVQAAAALPIMLFSLFAGAIADSLDRRRVMIVAQVFMLVVSTVLTISAWAAMLNPWSLLIFTFLIGCGTAINNPAWQASVGDIVPRPILPDAVALNSMNINLARSVGPAIGGIVVASAGAAAAFLANALSYVGLLVVLIRWPHTKASEPVARERLAKAMGDGVRFSLNNSVVSRILVRTSLFGLAASAIPAMMPLVTKYVIGGGPLVYGLLLGAFGTGAVGGALVIRPLRRRRSIEQIVQLASIMTAMGAAVTGISGNLFLTITVLVLAGSGWVLAFSTFNVCVQLASPRWVVARALSLYQMSTFGGIAVGSWLLGALADHQGVTIALCTAAAVQIICVLIGLRWPLPSLNRLERDSNP